MILDYQSILETPILNFSRRDILGIIKDPIVDPDTGKIEAFWVKTLTIDLPHAIILPQDILKWDKNIYIKDDSSLLNPADVIKITEILKKKSFLMGDRVESKTGKKYGRVFNIDFNIETFYVSQFHVKKSFLGIGFQKYIFSFDTIVEIRPSLIIIDDESRRKDRVLENSFVKDAAIDPA